MLVTYRCRTAAMIATLLAGCALSPVEVMDRGAPIEATSERAPVEVADCVYRNTEMKTAGIAASRTKIPNGGIQVIVRSLGEISDTLSVIRAMPSTSGTSIKMWISPNVMTPHLVAERHLSGC